MISIVIPAFNEAGAVGKTIAEIRAVSANGALGEHEVIIVDDGSTDTTAAVVAEHGARVVSHPHNLGYGRALKSGIEAARFDTIVIMDADGTYPASEVPRLLEFYRQGFEMVVGARSGAGFKEPLFKTLLRAILTFLIEFTAGRDVPDVNSGLRVFSRTTVKGYFPQLCDTFSFTTSLTLAYMMTGRFVVYAPVGYGARVGATKVRLFRDALRTLQYILQAIVYFNPLKIFLLLSAACLLFTLLLSLPVLYLDARVAAVIGSLGLVGSLVIFGLGLVADLVRQQVRKP